MSEKISKNYLTFMNNKNENCISEYVEKKDLFNF